MRLLHRCDAADCSLFLSRYILLTKMGSRDQPPPITAHLFTKMLMELTRLSLLRSCSGWHSDQASSSPWTNHRGACGHVTSLHQSQLTWLQAGWPSHTRAGWTHTPDSGQMKYSGLVQARHRGPGPIRDEWTSYRPITAHLAWRRRRGSGGGPRTRARRGAAAGGRGRGRGGSGDPRNAPGADTARAAGTPGQTCRRCLMLATEIRCSLLLHQGEVWF